MAGNLRSAAVLLRNNCDGTFTDVTAAAGLVTPVTSSQTAVWADIDNDGWVDLFVGNEDSPAQLFHNKRNGTFVDIATSAGLERSAFTKGVSAGDYDNDGFPDFYVSNFRGGNFLYRNNGDRTFTEVATAAGVPGPDRGFPTWFFDYDNDGWDDLFAASFFLSLEETAKSYLGHPLNAGTMKLYRNAGNGRFLDVTEAVGTQASLSCRWAPTSATSTTTASWTSTWAPAALPTSRWFRACCCATGEASRSSM